MRKKLRLLAALLLCALLLPGNHSGYCFSGCNDTAGITHSLRESDAAGSCCADTTGILKFPA